MSINLDTKAYIKFKILGYPHGKTLICSSWIKGEYKKSEIDTIIHNNMTFNLNLSDDYQLHSFELLRTNPGIKGDTSEYNALILERELDHKPKKQTQGTEKDKFNIRKINLDDYTLTDIEFLNEYTSIELFMRKHDLNDDEYEFYLENKDSVPIDDIKKLYKECNGDIYKMKKDKIREKLFK